jgi:hypothetical protein
LAVRLEAGRDAIRAYVSEHASAGLDHVLSLVTEDNNRILTLIGDLTEDEATAVTPADEWSVFDAMRHLSASIDRSRARLETLSSGRPFVAPPMQPGQLGAEYASFSELRSAYIDGMAAFLAVLRRADPSVGLDLTAEHAAFGPFNWLEWAIYSHHVHAHDHVGQIEAIRKALRGT